MLIFAALTCKWARAESESMMFLFLSIYTKQVSQDKAESNGSKQASGLGT